MRIGIDARLVPYQRGGISTYTQELVNALSTLEGEDSYELMQSRKGGWPGTLPNRVTSRTMWTPPHHRWEQWLLPLELAFARLDVLHSPDFIPPFRRRCPAVITVHDLDFLRYPETKPADVRRYYGQVRRAVTQAEGVIAVSETTKRDMVELLDAPEERIDVVHHGVSSFYHPLKDIEDARAFCRERDLPETFILWVSTIEPRKNLSCLLHALAMADLPSPLCKLVIVGSQGWRYEQEVADIDRLGLREQTVLYGPATREELLQLYNAAWVLVFPSFYEGFGMPPLEAMACGTPVISSTAPALREVLGDAALYCDPKAPSTLSELLAQLADDPGLGVQLREVGLRHAAAYRWEETARHTLAVYYKAGKVNLLFVTAAPPWPAWGGASLRAYHFMRLLSARHKVYLVCPGSVREELELKEALASYCQTVRCVPYETQAKLVPSVAGIVANRLPYLVTRKRLPALRQAAEEFVATRQIALVHIVGIEAAASLFPPYAKIDEVPVIFDELNAEYLLQKRAWQAARGEPRNWPRAAYSWVQARKLRAYETAVSKQVAGIVTTSAEDKAALEGLVARVSVTVVENGVDTDRYRPSDGAADTAKPTLLFTGTMDYRPNIDAVLWFAEEVLPLVRRRVPEAQLVVMGRDPSHEVERLAGPEITVTGAVEDDLSYFHRAAVYVLPMRFGGGTRLKLLQAMACGLPVVTTSMGASGIPFEHERHGLIADSAEAFAEATIGVLQNVKRARCLGIAARELALQADWGNRTPLLESFYEQVLG